MLLSLASCGKDNDYTAYFGGQVSNARVPYVIFSRGNTIIDTLPLDKTGHFFIKFDSLTPGMYSFKHEPDYQYVYFDKNDSIMVVFNSGDFDRSVVFNGRGERKNNFMVELYMMNEAERHDAYDLYGLDFESFNKAIDSINKKKLDFYNKNKAETKWSSGFDFYAKARADFSYLVRKEYYPYIHMRRTGEDITDKLPANYYDFRKKINFNDRRLTTFSPFVRYINGMLSNMAMQGNIKNSTLQENALNYNIAKLNIVDSIFKDQVAKNEILNSIAFNYLLEDQNMANNQKFLQRYMELSTDDNKDNEIRRIGEAIKNLGPGQKLPEVKLVDINNKPFMLGADTRKETVIFFWTSCARAHLENVYQRVQKLQLEHPEINFIAINVDKDAEWKKNIAKHPLKSGIQLRSVNYRELKDKWAFTKINRTIVLNADGTIKNAFTNLLDTEFGKNL